MGVSARREVERDGQTCGSECKEGGRGTARLIANKLKGKVLTPACLCGFIHNFY